MGCRLAAFHEGADYDLRHGRLPLNCAGQEVSPRADCLNELVRYHLLVHQRHPG